MKSYLSWGVSAVLAAAFYATAAFALEDAVKQACEPDIAAYCAAVSEDDDAVKSCLEENKDVVSAQCRQAIDESEQS